MAVGQLGLKSYQILAGWLILSEAAAMLQGRLDALCVARTQPMTRVGSYRQHVVCGVANSLLWPKTHKVCDRMLAQCDSSCTIALRIAAARLTEALGACRWVKDKQKCLENEAKIMKDVRPCSHLSPSPAWLNVQGQVALCL